MEEEELRREAQFAGGQARKARGRTLSSHIRGGSMKSSLYALSKLALSMMPACVHV